MNKVKQNTKRNLKAVSKKAAEVKLNKATTVAALKEELKKPAVSAVKPNVRFNNFEKRSTYEAVAQLAKTGSQSMKSACEKLRLMGWDKHELDAR